MSFADEARPGRFALVAVAVEISLVPLASGIERIWPGARWYLGWTADAIALGVVGSIPPLALLLWMVSPRWRDAPFLRRIRDILREAAGSTMASLRWQHALPIGLAAGLGEEVLFRAVLQPRLGLVATSILFGAIHPFSPAYVAIAGILGFYLGWLQERQGNVLVPAIAHAIYDVIALLVIGRQLSTLRERDGPSEPPDQGSSE